MSTFEFVFSLFGLLLGLSLAEVLSGLARAVRSRDRVAIGWQSPLLGVIVMLDLTAFWLLVWGIRDNLHPTYRTLVIGLLISGLYYLAASMIFPQEGHDEATLDAHYQRNKAAVLGALLMCNVAAYVAVAVVGSFPINVWNLAHMSAFAALALGVMFLKSKPANIVLLSLMCAMYITALV